MQPDRRRTLISAIRGLPRYYIFTALAVLLLLIAAGGLIGYRVVADTLVDEVSAADAAFARANYAAASAIARGEEPDTAFIEALQAEQTRRPVVMVRVYDNQSRIMYSTDAAEIGQYHGEGTLNYWRGAPPSSRLAHYRAFDTGSDILTNRDILSTRIGLNQQSYSSRGSIEVYTDITLEQRRIVTTSALICGVLSVVLVVLISVVVLSPHRPE